MDDIQDLKGSFFIFKKYGLRGKRMFGRVYHPHLSYESINYLRNNFESKSHDVFITTYAKCGTTLTQQICVLLMKYTSNNSSKYDSNEKWWTIPWFERKTIKNIKLYINKFKTNDSDNNNLRIWKTHSSFNSLPMKSLHKDTKFIIVCRNPNDCAVSYYNHVKNVFPSIYKYSGNISHFINHGFIMGLLPNGLYWDFYRKWWDIYHSKKYQILWVYYEDILSNPKHEITRIAKFLNIYHKLGSNPMETDKMLSKISHECSFKFMSNEHNKMDDTRREDGFFRKGIIGDWKRVFTGNQADIFAELNRYYFYGTQFKYLKQFSKL